MNFAASSHARLRSLCSLLCARLLPQQILVSGFHLFGTVAFFVNEFFQNNVNTKPAFDVPYGLGFIFSNSVWIIVPAYYIYESFVELRPLLLKASRQSQEGSSGRPNGTGKSKAS